MQVPDSSTTHFPIQNSVSPRGEVLQTAVLGLDRVVTKHDLGPHSPAMRIKCVASIYTAYYKAPHCNKYQKVA